MVDESPYSKREQDEKFIDMKEQLNRIEAQTLKTNGSVANLNLKQAKQEGFNRATMIYGGIFATAALAVVGWAFLQINHLAIQQSSLQEALNITK